ncbi:M48 family metalloprotease [Sphingomonas sp. 2R-10]|uniref:M48 family metallopeptidase n=1 Tax=Sphingomonas sp. 2R-10 TaxID=3045148 RepID=UPI0019D0AC1D|nr:M48 family metallopeptidase [Sphingomonas sp. 2R-10]MDJ0275368.1 M48 family metalloprotease [Sphingomonas sp. 2R-10]
MNRLARGAAGLCALLAIAAAPKGPAAAPPPYAGVYQPQGVDEIGFWREADEDERALANAPEVIRDEALNAYVRGVLCDTVGKDRCGATRVYILRTPVFNASMTPNGTMRVFSGLLLRVRNEAELGAILGHEFGHFELRHTVTLFKAHRSGTDLLSWAAVFASMSPGYGARSNFNDLQWSVYGSLYRYGRDMEREADLLGLGYLNAGTLRPQAAASVWRNVMAEGEASSRARGLSKPRYDQLAFSASHPPSAERALTLAALADPGGEARDDGAERYAKAMAPWLPMFLDDQVKLNDFGASDFLIAELAETGWTAPLWLARGELYRARGNPRDLVNAAEFYTNATTADPGLAEAYRGLGLSLLKTGRPSEGRTALRRYLTLKPDAKDAGMIAMLAPADSREP